MCLVQASLHSPDPESNLKKDLILSLAASGLHQAFLQTSHRQQIMPKAATQARRRSMASGNIQKRSRRSSAWSLQSDQLLMSARREGLSWEDTAKTHFLAAGKSANACRKRHERLMDWLLTEEWDAEKLELLATHYLTPPMREQMWTPLAELMGEHWTLIEAKCMENGVKNLEVIAGGANKADAPATESRPTEDVTQPASTRTRGHNRRHTLSSHEEMAASSFARPQRSQYQPLAPVAERTTVQPQQAYGPIAPMPEQHHYGTRHSFGPTQTYAPQVFPASSAEHHHYSTRQSYGYAQLPPQTGASHPTYASSSIQHPQERRSGLPPTSIASILSPTLPSSCGQNRPYSPESPSSSETPPS